MGSSFTRGTTPDYRFTVNQDISEWDVYLSFGQKGREKVRVRNPTIVPTNEGCAVVGTLSQKDTLSFKPGKGEAQIRCYRNGAAAANPIKFEFYVYDIIMDGTIPKGGRP